MNVSSIRGAFLALQMKYVYAIIDCSEEKAFGRIGLKESLGEVYTVPYQDVSAVVCDVPLHGGSRSHPIELGEENWLKHEGVVSRLMSYYTVLPVKFGSLLKFDRDLDLMLRRIYGECRSELKKFQGKCEVGVKILLDDETVQRKVVEKGNEIKELVRKMADARDSMMRRKHVSLGEAIERQLDNIQIGAKQDESALKLYYANEFYETLKTWAEESKANKLVDTNMILNGSFLIRKDETEDFRCKLDQLRRRHDGFQFLYSGPWASYSFTKIRYY